MTKQEILMAIEVQQQIQMKNPPVSKASMNASKEIHRLAELLTGKKPKDACGR